MTKQSGVPGVYWDKSHNSWRVNLESGGKKIYLGRRKTLEEAVKLRLDAEVGILPTDEEKKARLFDKMARIRMRAVWREATKCQHEWKSFDDFMMSVGDRPKRERRLVAKDEKLPIGPENFQWIRPKYDHLTKEGRSEYQKAHRAANPMLYKDKDLRKKFGIGVAEYQTKLEEQKDVCAICREPERGTRNGTVRWLNVDHNHETKAVRGLLCTNCNVAVGMMYENHNIMRSAMAYLDKWECIESGSPDNNAPNVNGLLCLGA